MVWGNDDNGRKGNTGSPWGRPAGSNSTGPRKPANDGTPENIEMLFKRRSGGGGGGRGTGGSNPFKGFSGGDNSRMILLGLVGAFFFWLATGIYYVDTDQQGVVLRFGEYNRTTSPGLHYRMPYPIEKHFTPRVTTVNRVEVGFFTSRSGAGGKVERFPVPKESLMLTGDENIVEILFEVQWKIKDAAAFLFNVRNPETTLKEVAESVMREIISQSKITNILEGTGRNSIEVRVKTLIQQTMDRYGAGIDIQVVNMLKADPPSAVIDAYRDVQTARQDMERLRNEAEAYRNDILPRARGRAEQMTQDALAYKQEVVARAQGDVARFISVYNEYQNAQDVTRQRIYIETMEEVLKNMEKIIIDPKAGGSGVVPYMALPDLRTKQPQPAQ